LREETLNEDKVLKGRNMRTVFIFFFSIVAALMLAETLSRLAFRLYYGVPFHDRRIAEYPYADFVEAADPPLRYVYINGISTPTHGGSNGRTIWCTGTEMGCPL